MHPITLGLGCPTGVSGARSSFSGAGDNASACLAYATSGAVGGGVVGSAVPGIGNIVGGVIGAVGGCAAGAITTAMRTGDQEAVKSAQDAARIQQQTALASSQLAQVQSDRASSVNLKWYLAGGAGVVGLAFLVFALRR
jgi:hypothetical protein